LSSAPLHILEKKVLQALQNAPSATIDEICNRAGIGADQARRALEWLKEKGYVEISQQKNFEIALGDEGKKAVAEGLPERRIVATLADKKVAPLEDTAKLSGLERGVFSGALGAARALGWIDLRKEDNKTMVLLKSVPPKTDEEKLLSKLFQKPALLESLTAEENKALTNLSKRPNFIQLKTTQMQIVKLTEVGANAPSEIRIEKEIDALTPDIIVSGRWKEASFRPLNVEEKAPAIFPGKKHPLQNFIDEVREIFVSMGFEEIEGTLVQSSFWNFDALFTAQDHPSREMQDTFYLVGEQSRNPASAAILQSVSNAHVNGGGTGSKGWEYKWRIEEAERTVLRTHTTCTTVKYLADKKPEEARIFSVGKVFRNEKVSYKHIAEFHQVEGIVVGKNVTMRDIMGLLGKFYQKLGFQKTKFWPTYFPYTEPSLQSMVYFENLDKWLELGGMGIFRPEVTLPLGVKNPVLAWGLGLERLVMLRYDMKDIREIYGNNMSWLRSASLRQ